MHANSDTVVLHLSHCSFAYFTGYQRNSEGSPSKERTFTHSSADATSTDILQPSQVSTVSTGQASSFVVASPSNDTVDSFHSAQSTSSVTYVGNNAAVEQQVQPATAGVNLADNTLPTSSVPVSPERRQMTQVTDCDPLGLFGTPTMTTAISQSATLPAVSSVLKPNAASMPQTPFGSTRSLALMAASSGETPAPAPPPLHTIAGNVSGGMAMMYSSNDSLPSAADRSSLVAADAALSTPKGSRWKPASWKSEKLGSALKFAASAVGTKLQRGWQQTVGVSTPPGRGENASVGSTGSLNTSRTGDDLHQHLADQQSAPQRQRTNSSQLDSRGSLEDFRAVARPVINRNVALGMKR